MTQNKGKNHHTKKYNHSEKNQHQHTSAQKQKPSTPAPLTFLLTGSGIVLTLAVIVFFARFRWKEMAGALENTNLKTLREQQVSPYIDSLTLGELSLSSAPGGIRCVLPVINKGFTPVAVKLQLLAKDTADSNFWGTDRLFTVPETGFINPGDTVLFEHLFTDSINGMLPLTFSIVNVIHARGVTD